MPYDLKFKTVELKVFFVFFWLLFLHILLLYADLWLISISSAGKWQNTKTPLTRAHIQYQP